MGQMAERGTNTAEQGFVVLCLPWCPLDRKHQIGQVEFVPWSKPESESRFDEAERKVLERLHSALTVDGEQCVERFTVIRFRGKILVEETGFATFSRQAAQALDVLACSALSNRYRPHGRNATLRYVNSDCFKPIEIGLSEKDYDLRKVRIPIESPYRPHRRHPYWLSKHPVGKRPLVTPLECQGIEKVIIDESLLPALAKATGLESDPSSALPAIADALVFYRQACLDDMGVPTYARLLLLSAAFDSLLLRGKSKGPQAIACKFDGCFPEKAASVPSGNPRSIPDGRSAKWIWMKHFYSARSAFAHGSLRGDRGLGEAFKYWSLGEHLFLGALAFPLALKAVLAQSGFYELTEWDRIEIQAFDEFAYKEWTTPDQPRAYAPVDMWQRTVEEVRQKRC